MIYLAALAVALFVQRPKVKRIIELTGGHTGAPAPAPAGPNAAAGPPPGLMEAVSAVQRNGILLTVALIAIIFLMVVKPSLGG